MGAASDAVVMGEAASGDGGEKVQKGGEELSGEEEKPQQEGKDGGGQEEVVVGVDSAAPRETRVNRLQTHHPVSPIQVAPHGHAAQARSIPGSFQPTPPLQATPSQMATPPGGASTSLNSRRYTNRISLFLFLLHLVLAGALICFFCFKAVEGLLGSDSSRRRKERHVLAFWLPPVEGSAVLSMVLAFAWQKVVREFPTHFTVCFIIWFSFASSMAAGIMLLCFSMPATDGAGVALIAFALGAGLYACWATRRTAFAAQVLARALQPAEAKFRTLNRPAYLMMLAGFAWISLWCFAVIGAHNFYYPPLTVLLLVLSLMWTSEVMRNVANLTVSRVVALYYLRGMQSDVSFCFQRALTRNLGSACLGSLFVPAIEACRIIARALNLLEGEDEFMFSCAHCCLNVMNTIFRYGNSWAFVHVRILVAIPFTSPSPLPWHLACGFRASSWLTRLRDVVPADSGVWKGVRGGVAEHLGAVRGPGAGAGGGLGHHQLHMLPVGGGQWLRLRHLRRVLDLLRPPPLHRHRLPPRLLRRLPHDPDRDGAAAGLRGVLLRVLRREPHVQAVHPRQHHHPAPRAHPQRPRPPRRHPPPSPPLHRRRLTTTHPPPSPPQAQTRAARQDERKRPLCPRPTGSHARSRGQPEPAHAAPVGSAPPASLNPRRG